MAFGKKKSKGDDTVVNQVGWYRVERPSSYQPLGSRPTIVKTKSGTAIDRNDASKAPRPGSLRDRAKAAAAASESDDDAGGAPAPAPAPAPAS